VTYVHKFRRRAYTVRDLAATLACLLVAGGLLASLTGAGRDLSQTQTCMNNLRQLFAGMTAYVNQYNSYPPNAPNPYYGTAETISGVDTGGWDPNMGFILTHGLGFAPPATDPATGHFKWYGTPYAELPDVCKCPAMPAALLDPANPELADPATTEGQPLETLLYQYALSYQTSGTIRAAAKLLKVPSGSTRGQGGREPSIPDPTSGLTSQPYDNAVRGMPLVWVAQKPPGRLPDDPFWRTEYECWIQAIHPGEVQAPARTYYLADSRDYRPRPKGEQGSWPPAGTYNGWDCPGNRILVGTRHFSYANVLYLDGRVSRDEQMHVANWNMDYDPGTGQARSSEWRCAAFSADIRLADIRAQVAIMPVLRVRGWEYFFDGNGIKPH
jgi:prepilin-type processing-associated H-X9-DG protein